MLYGSIMTLRDLHDLLRQQNEIAFWRCPAAHFRQFSVVFWRNLENNRFPWEIMYPAFILMIFHRFRCAARNVSVYKRRWCTCIVPRVHIWHVHILLHGALSCTIRAYISLTWLVETVFLKKSYSLQQYYFITPGSLTPIWPRKY